ncbi:hypothetical protein Zmor_014642 [Zophobas morio]|uniref:Uncharacterized protein n=1 Tax=Zophobas morio TaxID=2755281 RepID=A0AA38IL15_9CUCU|nr:hypothetical protein Zmor_014642 [Zophobas morio]
MPIYGNNVVNEPGGAGESIPRGVVAVSNDRINKPPSTVSILTFRAPKSPLSRPQPPPHRLAAPLSPRENSNFHPDSPRPEPLVVRRLPRNRNRHLLLERCACVTCSLRHRRDPTVGTPGHLSQFIVLSVIVANCVTMMPPRGQGGPVQCYSLYGNVWQRLARAATVILRVEPGRGCCELRVDGVTVLRFILLELNNPNYY